MNISSNAQSRNNRKTLLRVFGSFIEKSIALRFCAERILYVYLHQIIVFTYEKNKNIYIIMLARNTNIQHI